MKEDQGKVRGQSAPPKYKLLNTLLGAGDVDEKPPSQ